MEQPVVSLASVRELIEAVQRGSRTALKRLYELESTRLYGVALRILRRPDLAADTLQDTFVQIWQRAGSFSADRGNAEAWLTSIVRYRAIDLLRKRGREILSDDPTLGDRAEEPDVIERIEEKKVGAALKKCLDGLDEGQRRCIVLAFVDGLSHSDIAARLPAPLGSVKSWVRRGLISLRSCLET